MIRSALKNLAWSLVTASGTAAGIGATMVYADIQADFASRLVLGGITGFLLCGVAAILLTPVPPQIRKEVRL